jgi:hypothetical protein
VAASPIGTTDSCGNQINSYQLDFSSLPHEGNTIYGIRIDNDPDKNGGADISDITAADFGKLLTHRAGKVPVSEEFLSRIDEIFGVEKMCYKSSPKYSLKNNLNVLDCCSRYGLVLTSLDSTEMTVTLYRNNLILIQSMYTNMDLPPFDSDILLNMQSLYNIRI